VPPKLFRTTITALNVPTKFPTFIAFTRWMRAVMRSILFTLPDNLLSKP
jgi:hypothetical protein